MPRAMARSRPDARREQADRPPALVSSQTRVEAVMAAAERSGLLDAKSLRIGTRISPALLDRARKQTGIETNTDLIAFALASVALEDDFAAVFEEIGGTVDPDLTLGF